MATSNNNNAGESKENVGLEDILETFGSQSPKQQSQLDRLYQDRYQYQKRIPILLKENEFLQRSLRNFNSNGRKATVVNSPLPTEMKQLNTTKDVTRTILQIYGTMFGLIFKEPRILSPIYESPPYKYSEMLVKLLTESLLPNHYDTSHEHILTRITEDVMEYEFINCEDLTTYLRENTCATKLLSSFLKRSKNAKFVENTIKDACIKCLDKPNEDLEIDPNTIFEKSINAMGEYHANNYVGPEDPRILKLCEKRRRKLQSFVDHVLNTIIHPKQAYPIGLRIICNKLRSLALSREPNNERLANGLVGGFLFLRIFNPRITLYSYEIAKKDPKNMASIRRRFTLISKIIQNISNQVEAGAKEKWMSSLNKFVQSRIKEVTKFFREICNVPDLNQMFEIDQKIRRKQPGDEVVFISVGELNLLKKMATEQLKRYQPQSTDSLAKREFYDQIRALSNRSFINTPKDDIHGEYAKTTYVPINVHITDNGDSDDNINDPTLQTERGLTQSLKISVIPVFYEIYNLSDDECDTLLRQLETQFSKNNNNINNKHKLVSNCILFLQRANELMGSEIHGIDNAISILTKNDLNKNESALKRLYNKASELNDIFQRISIDTEQMRVAFEIMEKLNKDYKDKLESKKKQMEAAKLQNEMEHTQGQQRTFARIMGLVTANPNSNDNNNKNNKKK